MEPVLNERSLEPAEMPIVERVTSLIVVLRKLDALGFPRILRHARDALDREIEEGTSLRSWLFRLAARETRQFLAGRMMKAPFVEELHGQQEDAKGWLLQASYNGAPAAGAGIAHLLDAPAVALRGVPCWEVDPLVILLARMGDEDGTLVELPVEVVHVCRPEQVDARAQLLRERVLRSVSGGDELWRRRTELFPRLDFCGEVERQVCALSGKEFYFQRVVEAFLASMRPLGSGSAALCTLGWTARWRARRRSRMVAMVPCATSFALTAKLGVSRTTSSCSLTTGGSITGRRAAARRVDVPSSDTSARIYQP